MAAAALHWLAGARLQRLDTPAAGVLCLTLYGEGQRHHLLAHHDGSGRVALVPDRPLGEAAAGLAQRLRKHLRGARLREGSWRGGSPARPHELRLDFERGGAPCTLCILLSPRCANLVCLDARGRAVVAESPARLKTCGGRLGASWQSPPPLSEGPFPDQPEAWRARAATAQPGGAAALTDEPRARAVRTVQRRIRKVARRQAAIEADLARAQQSLPLRADAEWLLCHLDRVPRGAAHVVLPPREEHGEAVAIELDPALGPVENAERWFARARRFERGRPIAEQRLAQTRDELARLHALVDELRAGRGDPAQVEATLAGGHAAQRPQPSAPVADSRGPARRSPYREFLAEGEHPVRVGRRAADNDLLTLHHARPHDLWLHVRGAPGSHVVVPLDRGKDCPDRVRLDAALLAAHFSTLRDDDPVDIVVTERRYVRKRRGSPPGSVQLDREKVLHLRGDVVRLRWLLQRERAV